MPKLTVNGNEVEFDQGMTVLQACELGGAEIPRFCYHERLKIAGNCRMCLVQIEGGPPKPAASCAMPATEGMVVHTDSEMVKKAREGVMEFLLINHPLDCPICDQGGECDLQDQAMAYGRGESRFYENKRAVKDKYMGPLIKTHMTRCIHCTRCVRFLDDVSGIQELGAVGRGEHMQISTYVEKSLSSELSGNIIDLCPVGALTSKPYAFKSRPWELRKTESIDVLDAVGANIRIDSRNSQVLRIMPRLNEAVNEEWINDKTRFACDGLAVQRLDRPYVRQNGKLKPASWEEAFNAIKTQMEQTKPGALAGIIGDLADAESMVALNALFASFGSPHLDCRQDGTGDVDQARSAYLLNTGIAKLEQLDACLLIGTNPRHEATLVNTRIRKAYLENNAKIAYVGPEVELSYPAEQLGDSLNVLEEIESGKHPFAKTLKTAEKPVIILGSHVLTRKDGRSALALARSIAEKYKLVTKEWNGFNVLQRAASRVAGLELGIVPGKNGMATQDIIAAARKGKVSTLYLLGADEVDVSRLDKCFVIYQGHHGDVGAHHADVILPGAAYTEKSGTYVNVEGRPQRTAQAIFPPGEAKEDWWIIDELAHHLGIALELNSLEAVRARINEIAPQLANIGQVEPATWEKFGEKTVLDKAKLSYPIQNFYMTDPISRASKTMAQCSKDILKKEAA